MIGILYKTHVEGEPLFLPAANEREAELKARQMLADGQAIVAACGERSGLYCVEAKTPKRIEGKDRGASMAEESLAYTRALIQGRHLE